MRKTFYNKLFKLNVRQITNDKVNQNLPHSMINKILSCIVILYGKKVIFKSLLHFFNVYVSFFFIFKLV